MLGIILPGLGFGNHPFDPLDLLLGPRKALDLNCKWSVSMICTPVLKTLKARLL